MEMEEKNEWIFFPKMIDNYGKSDFYDLFVRSISN